MSNEDTSNPIKLVALCGSLRTGSYAKSVLELAVRAATAKGAEVTTFDLAEDPLPFCDGRKDSSTYPASVHKLRKLVTEADGLLLSTPEYHNSLSGVLKNALDLLSFEHMAGKVCGILSVAGGAMAMSSCSHLRIVLRAVHATAVPLQVMIPKAYAALDDQGELTDPKLAERLDALVASLIDTTSKLRAT